MSLTRPDSRRCEHGIPVISGVGLSHCLCTQQQQQQNTSGHLHCTLSNMYIAPTSRDECGRRGRQTSGVYDRVGSPPPLLVYTETAARVLLFNNFIIIVFSTFRLQPARGGGGGGKNAQRSNNN